jgi:hypothetical protein
LPGGIQSHQLGQSHDCLCLTSHGLPELLGPVISFEASPAYRRYCHAADAQNIAAIAVVARMIHTRTVYGWRFHLLPPHRTGVIVGCVPK